MTATLIAHLTDPHTTTLEGVGLSELLSKRVLGYLSWYRKRRYRHTQYMLDAATAAALAHKPDALVLTGDLLHIGLAREMREIRPWLESLTEQLPVMLVPGNHDLYAQDSNRAWQQELGDLPVFGDALSTEHEWPRQLLVNNVRILGLSSAYPAPFTRADGRLGRSQCSLLERAIKHPPDSIAHTLLALHHPAEPGLSEERKSLLDSDQLQSIITSASIDGLIHGHLHQNIRYQIGQTPCFCTASASSTYAPALASYRLFGFADTGAMSTQLYTADQARPPTFLLQ